MNRLITDTIVQDFLTDHLNDDVSLIALRKSPFPGISAAELATQLDGKKRALKKLPHWAHTTGIYYPPRLNMEQCSSELSAAYKVELTQAGTLADLTGGFGVDSFAFAKRMEHVVHLEMNEELSAIANHNASVFGINNISFLSRDCISYLKEKKETFENIFIDPARRVENKKVFLLQDTVPNVIQNLDTLKASATRLIIKTSPLLDIQAGLQELGSVSAIHVVSIKNDCKELLWVIDQHASASPKITCAMLDAQHTRLFEFYAEEEAEVVLDGYSEVLNYLYEPDVALLKAGCFKLLCRRFGVKKLHRNSHLYTSNERIDEFPGRTFLVKGTLPYAEAVQHINKRKANIIARNFPMTVAELSKKHKLVEGGNDFLLFSRIDKMLCVIEATRL